MSMENSAKKETEKNKTGIEINMDWCKGCGICVAFCPHNVLAIDEDIEKAVIQNFDNCNFCGLCELRCPDIAIELV